MVNEIPQEPQNTSEVLTPPILPTSSKKNITIILVIILVIVFGFSGYFLVNSGVFKQTSENNAAPTIPVSSINNTTGQLSFPENAASDEADLAAISKLPKEVIETKLYFQKSVLNSNTLTYMVYVNKTLASNPEVFLEADHYEFSPDKTKIAYIKEYGPKSDLNFYILDLKTNQTKTYVTDSEAKRGLEWSPDGTYILVNSGTGSVGVNDVFEVVSGKQIGSFSSRSGLVWIDDENFYKGELDFNVDNRPWEGGESSSIVKMNIRTQESIPVLQADEFNDYFPIRLEGDCLYFGHTFVNSSDEWNNGLYKQSTMCLNIKNGEKRIATENELQGKDYALFQVLKDKFQIKTDYDISIIENKQIKDWRIFSVYSGNSIYSSGLYIVNVDSPETSIIKIGKGSGITWIK